MTRTLLVSSITVAALTIAVLHGQAPKDRSFRVVEASIPEMRDAMAKGRVTSREIVSQHLIRLALYEDRLHAALMVNPRALEEAEQRDRERAAGSVRGRLHGIPIALKDNIHSATSTPGWRPSGRQRP